MDVHSPQPGDRVINVQPGARRSVGRVVEPDAVDDPSATAGDVLVAWPTVDHGPRREWCPPGDLQVIGG